MSGALIFNFLFFYFLFVVIRDGVNTALFLSFLFVPGPVTTAVPDKILPAEWTLGSMLLWWW